MTAAALIKIAFVLVGVILWLAKKAAEANAAKQAQRAAEADSPASGQESTVMSARVGAPPTQPLGAPTVLARGTSKGTSKGAGFGNTASAAKLTRIPAKPASDRPFIVDRVQPTRSGEELDSSAALQSRQHLLEQVARIKQAEARISAAGGIRADHSAMVRPTAPAPLTAAEIQKSLRDPRQIRKTLVLSEILGRPRAERAF